MEYFRCAYPSLLFYSRSFQSKKPVEEGTVALHCKAQILGGGFFAWQAWTAKKNPDMNFYKTFTLTNTAVTGGLGAIAARNYSLPSIQATPAASMPLPDYLRRVE